MGQKNSGQSFTETELRLVLARCKFDRRFDLSPDFSGHGAVTA
jgi:hypothetical protein